MKYYMFRLSFPYGVHFGDGNLDSSNMTFHADTLFSALFIEAVKVVSRWHNNYWKIRKRKCCFV